jgi:hypothetical protein
LLGSGCLPAGDPPVGQHIVSDRTLTGAFFAHGAVDGGESTLLASGPLLGYFSAMGEIVFDLYHFPDLESGPKDGIDGLLPTVANVILSEGKGPADFVPQTDSAGRLICAKGHSSIEDDGSYVARIDFSTGEEVDLGWQGRHPSGFLMSPSRRRVFVNDRVFNSDDTISLIDPDFSTAPTFIDDDLYYGVRKLGEAGAVSSVYRDRIGQATESLLTTTGLVAFRTIPADVATQLLVSLETETGEIPYLLFDSKHLSSTLLPVQRGGAQLQSFSSDGHWLMFVEPVPEGRRLFLFDWTWGANASLILDGWVDRAEWRPGYHELWIPLRSGINGMWVATSDTLTGSFSAPTTQVEFSPDGRRSMFTRDGRHWLSSQSRTVGSDGISVAFFVGNADDPRSPPVQLNPWGEELASLWEMSDGRLLVGASALRVGERQDIFLVDADAGSAKLIASGGHLVALGQNRALALLNWQLSSSTGDLTLIDLENGAKTLLAENVYDLAVDAPANEAGTDTLAPGTRIAFLVRNRLASPYDGLWMARLP